MNTKKIHTIILMVKNVARQSSNENQISKDKISENKYPVKVNKSVFCLRYYQ